MKWQRIALMLTIISLLAAPLAWSQGGNAEQQIKRSIDQAITAMMKADTNSLEKLLADDFTAIHSDGTFFTKAQEIESVKSGTLKWDKVDVQDLKIRVYGNTAITTMQTSFKGSAPSGNPYKGTNRSTRVWVKQQGEWKCVSYQVTRVPSAS
ncbi:MAG: nuclear transport factor 2 family protein [Candidatus Korobacteraceae bacterium]|jgi:ketosteroid isomerase-like protein